VRCVLEDTKKVLRKRGRPLKTEDLEGSAQTTCAMCSQGQEESPQDSPQEKRKASQDRNLEGSAQTTCAMCSRDKKSSRKEEGLSRQKSRGKCTDDLRDVFSRTRRKSSGKEEVRSRQKI